MAANGSTPTAEANPGITFRQYMTDVNEEIVDHTSRIAAMESGKAPLASPALTGNPTAPTQGSGNNSTRIATTEFVHTALDGKAPLASPALTGTPTAPTPGLTTNNTRLATTEFVTGKIAEQIASKADTSHTHAQSDVTGLSDALAEKASTTALSAEATARANGDAAEATARANGDAAEATARAASDAHLAARITAAVDGRPGDDPDAFGIGVDGATPIDPSAIVVTAEGRAVRLAGEVVLATRAIFPLERGEIYRIDHRLWRSTNTDDEAGDAVTVAVRWFDKDGAYLSTSVLDTYTALLVGPVESRPHYASRVAGPQVDITPPLLARGFRLTVQHRGTTPRTDVSLLRVTRITGGTASIDLGAVEARVDALEAIRPVSATATVEDDEVLIIEPPSTFGVLRIVGEHAGRQVFADAMFTTSDHTAGPGMTAMARGTDTSVAASGSHLTAGGGLDGNVTIACDFAGAIRVSNRRGSTLRFAWAFSPVGL